MKKLLLIAASIVSISAFAQRNIDWATTNIISPDSMRSTSSGTTIQLSFEMKNLGPDTVLPGDTIIWQFSTTNTNPRIYYPGQTSFAIVMPSKAYAPNDTMMVSSSLTTNLGTNTSINVTIQVLSLVMNKGSVAAESTANTLNNAKTKSVVWYNQQGWPVGLSEALSNAKTNVYPNPVNDKLYFETSYEKAKNITVVDLAGKVVANINTEDMNTELDVTSFAKGLYFYEIKTEEGATIKSGKFNVQ
jgi:hypothetical protein